ncbi:MAG: phosphatidate cytidylyltransferase [Myxococcota bacterium]
MVEAPREPTDNNDARADDVTPAPVKNNSSDLRARAWTALIGIPILLALILGAPSWGFFLLVAGAGAICVWEYCQITLGDEHAAVRNLAAATSLAVVSVSYLLVTSRMVAVVAGVMGLMLYVLFVHKETKETTHMVSHAVTGLVYGGLMLFPLALMREVTEGAGPYWVLMSFGVVWGSDAGAYFAGRALGRTKLSPKISPNKTVEGSIGGLVASALIALGFDALFTTVDPEMWTTLVWWQVLAFAVPGALLGQLGDLFESMVKRAHGAKDSGTIIYGHGGMLDRIDALIFSSPWFYTFVVHFTTLPAGSGV